MCSSIIKVTSLLILLFSSSVYSQSGYFPGSTKDRIDDLEQQRMFDKIERGLDEIRRQNQELQRQQPQINPPIYSTPQNNSNLYRCSVQGEINCNKLNRRCFSNGATQWCER
jgi:hypothetical protein